MTIARTKNDVSTPRFVEFDILRFLAAFVVVCYHFGAPNVIGTFDGSRVATLVQSATQLGYLGVNVFFIISGFVILASASGKSAIDFAISRFCRLFPTYWVCLLLTAAALVAVGAVVTTPEFFVQVLVNATMLNNYVDVDSVDGVYWTLHVELKFYALVFLLCLVGWVDRVRWWSSVWLAIVLIHAATGYPRQLGWIISPSYSAYFIAGIGYFLVASRRDTAWGVALLTITIPMTVWHAIGQSRDFYPLDPDTARIAAPTVIALVHLTLIALVAFGGRMRASRSLFVLGGLTYPVYLLHNQAGKAVTDALSAQGMSLAASMTLVLVTVFVLSFLVHRYIDARLASQWRRFLVTRLGSQRQARRSARDTAIAD